MRPIIKPHIIKPLKRAVRYYLRHHVPQRKRHYSSVVRSVREKNRCNVLFIASSLPMWRYHDVVKLMQSDPRFVVKIAIIPFRAFTEEEQRRDVEDLTKHFASAGVDYEIAEDYASLKRRFRPDMIVYPQPYDRSYDDPNADWQANSDCLTVHTPYSVPLTEYEWYINIPFHNTVWKLYVASDIHQDVSRRMADNRGENTIVVGEPHADLFSRSAESDPWKQIPDGKKRKRLIWAPHFSVVSYNLFDRPDFNWSYNIIRNIAEEYVDKIQIAFKPHPRLRSELYKHPDWGKEKTDEFYSFWENSLNTQLETGEYIDLFKTSDAMIHNCGSFTAEYLFVGKPVGYITRNLDGIKADMNDFGRACQDAHYTLSSTEGIRAFVENVLLDGDDRMNQKRRDLYDSLLRSPNGSTVAENIYRDLVKSLFGDE